MDWLSFTVGFLSCSICFAVYYTFFKQRHIELPPAIYILPSDSVFTDMSQKNQ